MYGDQIAVFDSRLFRITLLRPDGSISSLIPLQSGPFGQLGLSYAAPLGQIVQMTGVEGTAKHPDGVYRDAARHFIVWNRTDSTSVRIGPFPGPERIKGTLVPLGYRFLFALTDSVVYEGAGKPGHIDRFSYRGKRLRPFEIDRKAGPVSAAEYNLAVKAYASLSMPPGARAVENLLSQVPPPRLRPYYTDLRSDREGRLWIRMAGYPADPADEWWVVDRSGHGVARVELPPNIKVLDVNMDGVLVLRSDELDIEHVLFYPLVKSSHPGP
jgi:hypothetical protein